MQYTENYKFKKPDDDDIYDIGNENDNMDMIDTSLKSTLDKVADSISECIKSVNSKIEELTNYVNERINKMTTYVEEQVKNLTTYVDTNVEKLTTYVNDKVSSVVDKIESLVSSKVDEKMSSHTGDTNNPHKVTLTQVAGSNILPIVNGGTGMSSNPTLMTNLGTNSADYVFKNSPRPGVTGTLTVSNGGTGKSDYTSTNTDYEYRGIKIQSTVPTSVTAGCIVLVY